MPYHVWDYFSSDDPGQPGVSFQDRIQEEMNLMETKGYQLVQMIQQAVYHDADGNPSGMHGPYGVWWKP